MYLRTMDRHLVAGFEGLLTRVMYVFDDALVLVDPPRDITAAGLVKHLGRTLKIARVPQFQGEKLITGVADHHLKRRKYRHITEFSTQFGEAGFTDPRITSAMLAEQLEHTERLPLAEIERVTFSFWRHPPQPQIIFELTCRGHAKPLKFRMRYNLPKAREAHEALTRVLGSRVSMFNPP